MRVIVAGNDIIEKENLIKILQEQEYKVIAKASDGFDAIKLCRQHNPDIVITEVNMSLLDGVSASKIINDEDIAGAVIFILPKIDKKIINKIKEVGAKGCILTPIGKEHLISTLEMGYHIGNQIRDMKKQKEILEKKFEDRKAIDKAKGILMVNEKLTEEQAYSKIRKYSMEKRLTMREIAESIIISNQFKVK